MDLFLNNRKVTLDENTFLNQGGEAEIYDIGEGEVIKLFKNPDHPDFAGNPDEQTTAEQRLLLLKTKLNELPENLPEQVVIPLEVITDQSGEKILGYTMKYISGATRLKSYRLAPSREELGVSNVDVVEIFRGLHHTVSELHQAGVVIGDFNELNVLIKNKVAYLIDVDSFQFGDYVCRMFTHPFVDPLLCAQSDDESRLVAPYTANSDWYAYTVMLLQSLLLVEPYGGKYDPFNTKDWIPHPERSLHSVSVFHSEVKYPKSSYPYETLPEELLQFFEEVFERNKRTVFPAYLLDMGWKKCASCGREYACER